MAIKQSEETQTYTRTKCKEKKEGNSGKGIEKQDHIIKNEMGLCHSSHEFLNSIQMQDGKRRYR